MNSTLYQSSEIFNLVLICLLRPGLHKSNAVCSLLFVISTEAPLSINRMAQGICSSSQAKCLKIEFFLLKMNNFIFRYRSYNGVFPSLFCTFTLGFTRAFNNISNISNLPIDAALCSALSIRSSTIFTSAPFSNRYATI